MNQHDKAFLYFMIPFAVLMAVAVPIIILWTRMSLPKYVGRWNRKKGPPESGHMVTLVLTDVEGSTELWEAFQEVTSNTGVLSSSTVSLTLMLTLPLTRCTHGRPTLRGIELAHRQIEYDKAVHRLIMVTTPFHLRCVYCGPELWVIVLRTREDPWQEASTQCRTHGSCCKVCYLLCGDQSSPPAGHASCNAYPRSHHAR